MARDEVGDRKRVISWSTFNAKLMNLGCRWQWDISRLYAEVWWCYSLRNSINFFWINIGNVPTAGQMALRSQLRSSRDVSEQLQCREERRTVWARSPPHQHGGWLGGKHTGGSGRSAGGLIFQFRQEMINYQTQRRNNVLRNSWHPVCCDHKR